MTRWEFYHESFENKWVPLLTESETEFGERKFLLFENREVAKAFFKRNLKNWMCGYMVLQQMHYEQMPFEYEVLRFPRKVKHPWIDVIEVSESVVFGVA